MGSCAGGFGDGEWWLGVVALVDVVAVDDGGAEDGVAAECVDGGAHAGGVDGCAGEFEEGEAVDAAVELSVGAAGEVGLLGAGEGAGSLSIVGFTGVAGGCGGV